MPLVFSFVEVAAKQTEGLTLSPLDFISLKKYASDPTSGCQVVLHIDTFVLYIGLF